MVVLDQDGVVETHAVIARAGGAGGVLLQDPQAGDGLAGVQDLHPVEAGHGHELGGEAGNPGEVLQEIESGPLPHQDALGRTLDPDGDTSLREVVAVLHQLTESDRRIHLAEDLPSQCDPAEDAFLSGNHLDQAALTRVDHRGTGEIAAAPVLGQGPRRLGLYLSRFELAQPA